MFIFIVYANNVLYLVLLKRLATKWTSSHSSFFEPASTGGLYGFTASGNAAETSEFVRDVISALKSIAKESPSIDALKKKV